MKKYDLDTEDICSRYLDGLSIRKIADIFEVSPKPIRRILQESNVELRRSKFSLNENYFHTINSSEKAYILGLIYADGSVCNSNGSYTFKITLENKDAYILNKINNAICSDREIYQGEKYSTLQVTNKTFFKNLEKLGVETNKSLKIKMPKFIPDNLMWDFIRGYFDGDGYFYFNKKRKKGVWAICCNYNFGQELFSFLELQGFHPYFCTNSSHKNTVEVRLHRKKEIRQIYNNLYSNCSFFFERKKNKTLDFILFLDCRKRLKEDKINKIISLSGLGLSNRKIALETGFSRYIVDKLIKEDNQ